MALQGQTLKGDAGRGSPIALDRTQNQTLSLFPAQQAPANQQFNQAAARQRALFVLRVVGDHPAAAPARASTGLPSDAAKSAAEPSKPSAEPPAEKK